MSIQTTDLNNTNEVSSTLEDTLENASNPFKTLFIGLGALAFILAIFALLPMFFTYLSEGDVRAPSELHPTDSAIRLSHQNSSYNNQPTVVLEKQTVPKNKYTNNLPMN
jgi:hypothetical protein